MIKKRIMAVVLITALTSFVFCVSFYFIDNAQNQIPKITQLNFNLNSGGSPVTIENIENYSELISMSDVSFCSEQNEIVLKEETVTPVLTNENFFKIHKFKINGSGFTEKNIKSKERVIVIGSNLALKLFFNSDALNKKIIIDNEQYKIIGIFQESEDFINQISTDGKTHIYIPYTCYDNYKNAEVSLISYDNNAPSAPLFEQMDLNQYFSVNFSEKLKVIENFKHIIFFILYIALFVIAIRVWYRICKRFAGEIRDNLTENYLLKSVKSIPFKYILFIVSSIGIPALLFVIFFISDFSIYIISKYIPYDNIFDVSYYLNAIIESSHTLNLLSLTGDTYLFNLYSNTFSIIVWLVIIFFLIFAFNIAVVYNFIKNCQQKYKT